MSPPASTLTVVAGGDTAASGSRSPALETLIAPLRTHPTTGQSFRNGGGHLFRNPQNPLYREQYSRDALGRITERDITALAGGATVTCAMDYSYAQQRLQSEVPSSASGCGTYTVGLLYDGRGNVLKHTAATPSATTLSITAADYDAQDRVVSYGASPASEPCNGGAVPVTYDRAGRVHKQGATTYTYDLLGNLLKVETLDAADLCAAVTITYDVDPQNRRVGRSVDGVFDAGWLYIGGHRVVAELDSAGKVVKSFTYGVSGHSPSAMMYRDPATGAVRRFAFVQDHVGSIVRVLELTSNDVVEVL